DQFAPIKKSRFVQGTGSYINLSDIITLIFYCFAHRFFCYLISIIGYVNFSRLYIDFDLLDAVKLFECSFNCRFTVVASHSFDIECHILHTASPPSNLVIIYFQLLLLSTQNDTGGQTKRCLTKTSICVYTFTRFRRSELVTTLTELKAIAAPAIHGASNPIAAIGIPALL